MCTNLHNTYKAQFPQKATQGVGGLDVNMDPQDFDAQEQQAVSAQGLKDQGVGGLDVNMDPQDFDAQEQQVVVDNSSSFLQENGQYCPHR
jgi:hypothetical protein